MDNVVYIGSYTGDPGNNGIQILSLNERKIIGSSPDVYNPSYIAIHNQVLYCVMEEISDTQPEIGGISAFSIDRETGDLTFLNNIIINNKGACHIAVNEDGTYLAAANYGEGSVSLVSLEKDGRIGQLSDLAIHDKNVSHAHCVLFSGAELFVTDLGLDKVFCYTINTAGKLTENEARSFYVKPGSGPRHLIKNNQFMYVINELSSDITVFEDRSAFTQIQNISTLPPYYIGENTCAAIRLSDDRQYLYATNRGHDSITVYSVDSYTGLLTQIQNICAGGKSPRDFNIMGDIAIAACQLSNLLNFFNVSDGRLIPLPKYVETPKPVCIK